MTIARGDKLRSAQLKMMRAILGRQRITQPHGDLETWVEWVQRVTAEVRQAMEANKIPHWVDAQRCKLDSWHERLGRMSCERWARKTLEWLPEGHRSRGRPCGRWSDQFLNPLLRPLGM